MDEVDDSALPIIRFTLQAIQLSHTARRAAIRAGVLDLLLSIYVRGFRNIYPWPSWEKYGTNGPLLQACNTLLVHLSNHTGSLKAISDHPLFVLWPQCSSFALNESSIEVRLAERWDMWEKQDRNLILCRLDSINDILSDRSMEGETTEALDACIDLLWVFR
jgi:hypothetical protein